MKKLIGNKYSSSKCFLLGNLKKNGVHAEMDKRTSASKISTPNEQQILARLLRVGVIQYSLGNLDRQA